LNIRGSRITHIEKSKQADWISNLMNNTLIMGVVLIVLHIIKISFLVLA